MIDLDALQDAAEKQVVANKKLMEMGMGVGGLGLRNPDMLEDMRAWINASENEHADTVLGLVAAHRAALSRLARVEALHESGPVHIVASDGATISRMTCLHCSQVQSGEIVQPGDAYVWPCPTVLALKGEEDGR